MTLPASGPLSFQDIEDEFGASGASGIKMSDYYGEGQTLAPLLFLGVIYLQHSSLMIMVLMVFKYR